MSITTMLLYQTTSSLVEQRKAEDAAKLKVLRKAAGAGFRALDRGEFKEFDSIDDLQSYLNAVSEKIV